MSPGGASQWAWVAEERAVLVPPHGMPGGVIAEVWKDPKRPGWRGSWRNVSWQFLPTAEMTMAAVEREIAERTRRS